MQINYIRFKLSIIYNYHTALL